MKINPRKLKISLSLKIILGMILGLGFGIFSVTFGLANFVSNWIAPIGEIFVRLLKMLAIPIILTSMIKGIYDLRTVKGLKKIAISVISFYLITTIIAVSIGVIFAIGLKPGEVFPEDKQQLLIQKYSEKSNENPIEKQKPLQFLVDIVPDNIFSASSKNSSMLQIIFFSVLTGIVILSLKEEKTKSVRLFIDSANDIVLKLVEIIMSFAPLGVFALIAGVICYISGESTDGTIALLKSLGFYAGCVILGLLTLILIIYPIILKLFSKINIKYFFKGILPAQLTAFSTSSSAATLPVTKKCVDQNLNTDQRISSFVLPIGATVNMDGTSLYQAVAAVFIAQVFGMDLGIMELLTIILTATLASIGAAAVPGAGMIILLIVLNSVNIPAEGLALIFAVDRPLDMLRTTVNITGDSVCAVTMNRYFKDTLGV
jgi:Na+/H+-dicarboxylate symporter